MSSGVDLVFFVIMRFLLKKYEIRFFFFFEKPFLENGLELPLILFYFKRKKNKNKNSKCDS